MQVAALGDGWERSTSHSSHKVEKLVSAISKSKEKEAEDQKTIEGLNSEIARQRAEIEKLKSQLAPKID